MIDKLIKYIEERFGIRESIERSQAIVQEARRVTLNGEEKWMLTQKNGESKVFDCTCVEKPKDGANGSH